MSVSSSRNSRRSFGSFASSISPPPSLGVSHTDSDSLRSSSRASSKLSGKSPSPKKPAGRVSTGRGGSGNLVSAGAQAKLADEVEEFAIQRRESTFNARVLTVESAGRGGTGNILAAVVAQSIPFDKSADPDDNYEEIIIEEAEDAKKDQMHSTGRGGTGNLLRTRPQSRSIESSSIFSKETGKSRPRSLELYFEDPDEAEEYDIVPEGYEIEANGYEVNAKACEMEPIQSPDSDGTSSPRSAPVTPALHEFPAPPVDLIGATKIASPTSSTPVTPALHDLPTLSTSSTRTTNDELPLCSTPVTPAMHEPFTPLASPSGAGSMHATSKGSPRNQRRSEGDRGKWWKLGRRQDISRARTQSEAYVTLTVQPDGEDDSFLEF